MTLWLMHTSGGMNVINPKGMIFDEEYLKKWEPYKFEIPDNTTDYMFEKYSMRLYYVVDGKIHVRILDKRNRA